MKITPEQISFLTTLRCERLSSNETNFDLVEGFQNRNPNLEAIIKSEAFEQDENSEIVYYLVKNSDGDILFYFSLKCGLLYDSFNELEQLNKIKTLYTKLITLQKDQNLSKNEREALDNLIESIRARKGLTKEHLLGLTIHNGENIIEELKKSPEENLKHVGATFAGLEIVHFCRNEKLKEYWSKTVLGQKRLGEVVFWCFLVPKVIDVMQIAGCQYLFLFAADSTDDCLLINYYRNLGFSDKQEHGTAISLYDYACTFMFQETKGLQEKRKRFFDDFNLGEDDV